MYTRSHEEKLKSIRLMLQKMVVKLIRCPHCGEEIELRDLYEEMEVKCKLCNSIFIYKSGKFLSLDTNEEYDLEELEESKEEMEEFEEFEEGEYYFEEEEY